MRAFNNVTCITHDGDIKERESKFFGEENDSQSKLFWAKTQSNQNLAEAGKRKHYC